MHFRYFLAKYQVINALSRWTNPIVARSRDEQTTESQHSLPTAYKAITANTVLKVHQTINIVNAGYLRTQPFQATSDEYTKTCWI